MNGRWYSSDAGNYDSYEGQRIDWSQNTFAACSPGLYNLLVVGGTVALAALFLRGLFVAHRRGGLRRCYCRCPKAPLTTTRATDGAKVLLDANGQPTDWEVVKTAGKCRQKTYYWNSQTGAVSWEVPAEAPTTNRLLFLVVGGTATVAAEKSRLLLVKSYEVCYTYGPLFVAYCRGGLRRCCARKRDRSSVELTPQGMEDTNDIRLATA